MDDLVITCIFMFVPEATCSFVIFIACSTFGIDDVVLTRAGHMDNSRDLVYLFVGTEGNICLRHVALHVSTH